MRLSSVDFSQQSPEGDKQCLKSELWHACAGPLVSLPVTGSHVVYIPQGHTEQVAASTNKEVDAHTPNYPSLPPQLICQLHNVTMHADVETDEVYAQMTLQPLSPQEQKEAPFLAADVGSPSRQPTNYFCKTLTASDTSTHGGFSVPRRAAEKVFPPLDYSQQPPAQELIARDLHENEWKFKHIFRGQPKRHLLTTGWSVFVSAKRLVAGDSVIFIWNEKNQLLLGIRRANRPQTVMPSSVLPNDSMHTGLLAAAAHAAATNSRFTVFYNPRDCPSEFVIPLAKYVKAVYHTCISVGMRFRMLFETEESSVRRYMGTVTGVSDLDPVRWQNSHWRSVKVGWDESTSGERQPRVSLWEIEPLTTFPMYQSPVPLSLKRAWPPGFPAPIGMKDDDFGMNSQPMWLRGDVGGHGMQSPNFSMTPWMQPRLDGSMLGMENGIYQAMAASALQEMRTVDPSKQTLPPFLASQQVISNRPAVLNQPQIMEQSLLHPIFHKSLPQNLSQTQTQCQSNLLQQQPQQQQQQQLLIEHQQVSIAVSQSSPSSQVQSPASQAMPSMQKQYFSESNANAVTSSTISPSLYLMGPIPQDESTHLLNVYRPSTLLSSTGRPPKRVAVDPLVPFEPFQSISPEVDQSQQSKTKISPDGVSLTPFLNVGHSVGPEGSTDPQNHLLFGVDIDPSSLLMQTSMSTLRTVDGYSYSIPIPFASSNYISTAGSIFSLNPALTPSSCVEESGYLQSPENIWQENSTNNNFVKVYKSGSFGRSLDISKYRSYHELCSELACMFGLEGQLEDPLRSGWQLVFVDQENDVLLVGDDSWQEFVNSIWCIKILSPQEMQKMGKRGLELLNSVQVSRLQNRSCDNYAGCQERKNISTVITSVGSLDYEDNFIS